MLKIYKNITVFSFAASIGFLSAPSFVAADTHLNSDTEFSQSVTWNKEGSPYILDEDISLPSNANFVIEPGVKVESGADEPHSIFTYRGSVSIEGTDSEPVILTGLGSLYLTDVTALISHADINSGTGLVISYSTTTIASSSIMGAVTAVGTHSADLTVLGSVIGGNGDGIYSFYNPKGPVLAVRDFECLKDTPAHNCGEDTGGEGNALGDDPGQSHIRVANSIIANNSNHDVFNATSNIIDASNNWWGNDTGPLAGHVSGPVTVSPWLTHDPRLVAAPACCSNVLFLPGIEASRLYKGQGGATNQLWEPNRNDDVRKLFLDTGGKSIDPSIYTKDIIDSVFGFSIYKNFIGMMNGIVSAGTINSWQSFPYDWRFSVDDVVTPSLINLVRSLASSSKTGKVTVVAHSDGGLVAKMLYKKLQDIGAANLIGKLVLVAVPELGTPQAIAGLLHGDGQAIFGGLFLDQSVARQLGQNMPGGYGLLPSRDYFTGIAKGQFVPALSFKSPIISFSSSSLVAYDSVRDFLTGTLDHRLSPDVSDTQSPILLHSSMIDTSQKIHDMIDGLVFSSSTQAISLIGWGQKTLSGIRYSERTICSPKNLSEILQPCPKFLRYVASTTLLGDGTVVSASAAAANTQDYFLKMGSFDHSTILNSDSALSFVRNTVVASSAVAVQSDPLLAIPGISNTFPSIADIHNNTLTLTVHSPVELNVYDDKGRHTGPIPNPDPTSDLGRYEVGIPDSQFSPIDDDTSVTVPGDGNYKVILNGSGIGTFTLDTEHDVNGQQVGANTFADLPVTPLLVAELDVTATTSTTTEVLKMDTDGDGVIDATSSPYGPLNLSSADTSKQYAQQYFQSLRSVIIALHLSPAKEKNELNKIDKIMNLLQKGKKIQATALADKAAQSIHNQHWVFRKMDNTKKQALLDVFDTILDSIEAL